MYETRKSFDTNDGIAHIDLQDDTKLYYGEGWRGGTITVTPCAGYTITKCVFNKSETVDVAPFTMVLSGTAVSSIEVYGIKNGYDVVYEFTTSSGVLTYTNNIITVTAGYCDGDGIDLRSNRDPVQITAVDGWMITKIEMVCKYTNVSPSADEITATNGTVTTQGTISRGTTVTIDNINANSTSISRNKSGWVEFNQFKIYYGIAHTHSFTYSASGATISATCGGTGTCDITEGLTLTISAPTGSLVYDGTTTYPATLSTGYNTTAFPGTYSISYKKDGSAYSGVPKDAGTYTASVTAGTGDGAKTASVGYTIAKAVPTITAAPTAGEITYGQTLANSTLTGGETSVAGTFAWKDSSVAPAVADSQTTEYDVVFTPTDGNYGTTECKVKLTVKKADSAVTKAPTAKSLTYTGQAQALVTAGTATGGEMQYALGTATEATQPYTTSIPTATNAGTYYVWYKVVGDENHTDTDPVSITCKIAADMTTLNAKISEATEYYNSIKTDYPTVAETLLAAIAEAKAVTDGNQSDVDAAVTALNDAINAAEEANQLADDTAAADAVEELIDAIGEVEYNDESKGKIDAARAAYDELTDDQKALVENDDVLTAAESKYDELKAAAETPDDPATPTDPDEPVEDGVCSICGKTHNGGIFDRLIGFIHSLIAIFRSMFSFSSSVC